MPEQTRILIADDHPLLRKGLRGAIEGESGLLVVSEVGDGEAAVEALQRLSPDIAVLDIDMPKLDGFGVARRINELGLTSKVIFLTLHTDEDFFDEAMDLGAKGYILKDSAMEEIAAGIRAVCEGRSFLSSAMTINLLRRRKHAREPKKSSPLGELTPSERQILKLIAGGLSSKEIADQIGIHYRTVENHRTNMCRKLGLEGANALLRFAVQNKADLDAL